MDEISDFSILKMDGRNENSNSYMYWYGEFENRHTFIIELRYGTVYFRLGTKMENENLLYKQPAGQSWAVPDFPNISEVLGVIDKELGTNFLNFELAQEV